MNLIPEEQRLKAFTITPQAMLAVFRSGIVMHSPEGYAAQVQNGEPSDAIYHHAYYDPTFGEFVIVLEHESFSPIPEGGCMEKARITLKEIQR